MTSRIRRPKQTKASKAAKTNTVVSCGHSSSKTKKQIAIALLERPEGASVGEMQCAMGWQEPSVRGFLAATVRKLPGVALVSEKTENGPRRYRIEAAGK